MIEIQCSGLPDVSVVMLVTREPEMVRPSLEALARTLPADVATEVIIVLNTARKDSRALVLDGVRGALVIESPANCGTAVGWNVAFAAARGAYVAVIHEDTHPDPGWLTGLLDAAGAQPRAFLIGSRILRPDRSTWAGGWIIWRDGWTTPLDEASAPELMASSDAYPVDFVGTASMLVERAAFLELGGFDEDTFPSVTTAVGLALAGALAGRTAVATTGSSVVHATQAMVTEQRGLYSSALYREFLIRRATRRLREKWADVLDAGYEPRGEGDPSGDPVLHARALAAAARCATRPAPATAPPSRISRRLSAPDGGWPTELDAAVGERLREAQREVDAEFDAWVLDDRAQLQARIMELDAGARAAAEAARSATEAHDNALAIIGRLEQEVAGLRLRPAS